MSDLTVVSHIYNEEKIIGFFIDQYRKNFPGCYFILHDHMSTDSTRDIIKKHAVDNFEIVDFNTGGQVYNDRYRDIKNNAWKKAKTNWICVADADEIIEVTEQDLINEEKLGTNIIKFQGYCLINMQDQKPEEINYDTFAKMNYGSEANAFSKNYCFNKKYIKEINYAHGAHKSSPIAHNGHKVQFSEKVYRGLHYMSLSGEITYQKNVQRDKRRSKEDVKRGYGRHYRDNANLQKCLKGFQAARSRAFKLFDLDE